MSNEVKVVDTPTGVAVVNDEVKTPASYNRKLGDKVIRIQIKTKRVKTDKNDFNSIKGLMHLPVINDDGVNEGKKNRWLDVHFKKEAFKGVPNECDVHSPDDLKSGFLYVRARGIQAPRLYKVTEATDKEGNVKYENGQAVLNYPTIWVQGDVVGFEPWVADQDAFDYVEPVADAEVKVNEETGEIIEEADDTEACEI